MSQLDLSIFFSNLISFIFVYLLFIIIVLFFLYNYNYNNKYRLNNDKYIDKKLINDFRIIKEILV